MCIIDSEANNKIQEENASSEFIIMEDYDDGDGSPYASSEQNRPVGSPIVGLRSALVQCETKNALRNVSDRKTMHYSVRRKSDNRLFVVNSAGIILG